MLTYIQSIGGQAQPFEVSARSITSATFFNTGAAEHHIGETAQESVTTPEKASELRREREAGKAATAVESANNDLKVLHSFRRNKLGEKSKAVRPLCHSMLDKQHNPHRETELFTPGQRGICRKRQANQKGV